MGSVRLPNRSLARIVGDGWRQPTALHSPYRSIDRVTGQPLDREATTASERALAIAPHDSISGHLNNALTVLLVGHNLEHHARQSDGSLTTYRAYDVSTVRDIEARLRAALLLLGAR